MERYLIIKQTTDQTEIESWVNILEKNQILAITKYTSFGHNKKFTLLVSESCYERSISLLNEAVVFNF